MQLSALNERQQWHKVSEPHFANALFPPQFLLPKAAQSLFEVQCPEEAGGVTVGVLVVGLPGLLFVPGLEGLLILGLGSAAKIMKRVPVNAMKAIITIVIIFGGCCAGGAFCGFGFPGFPYTGGN